MLYWDGEVRVRLQLLPMQTGWLKSLLDVFSGTQQSLNWSSCLLTFEVAVCKVSPGLLSKTAPVIFWHFQPFQQHWTQFNISNYDNFVLMSCLMNHVELLTINLMIGWGFFQQCKESVTTRHQISQNGIKQLILETKLNIFKMYIYRFSQQA